MKHLFGIAVLAFVAMVGFRIGGELSPDALGMAAGMLLGVMAGIPTALLVLASEKRRESHDHSPLEMPQNAPERPQITQSIHINELHLRPPQSPQRAVEPAFPQGEPGRAYRIIGQLED